MDPNGITCYRISVWLHVNIIRTVHILCCLISIGFQAEQAKSDCCCTLFSFIYGPENTIYWHTCIVHILLEPVIYNLSHHLMHTCTYYQNWSYLIRLPTRLTSSISNKRSAKDPAAYPLLTVRSTTNSYAPCVFILFP